MAKHGADDDTLAKIVLAVAMSALHVVQEQMRVERMLAIALITVDIDDADCREDSDDAAPRVKRTRRVNKLKHAERVDHKRAKSSQLDEELKRTVLHWLSGPPAGQTAKDLSASVALLTKSVVRKERLAEERAQWQQRVDAKERQLALLERRGRGETARARELEEELNQLYENPVLSAPVDTANDSIPSLAEGGGGGAVGGEGAESGTGGDIDVAEIEQGDVEVGLEVRV